MPRTVNNEPADRTLARRLGELAHEIPPEVDLWPVIEERIQPREQHWLPFAVAASVLLISVLLTFVLNRGPAEGPEPAQALMAEVPVWNKQVVELDRVRKELQPTLEYQLSLLEPQTRRVVMENLAIIEQARHNIATALQMRPQSVVLSNQYRFLWQREMAIYRQVSGYSYQM